MTARVIVHLVLRRLVAAAVLLVIISFGVFALLYAAPGSVEQVLLGTAPSTPQSRQAIREEYHLDDPLIVQYGRWIEGVTHFDFGRSIRTREPVLSGIKDRMGLTLFLGLYGFVIALLLGVLLGIVSALKKRTALDRGLVGLSVIGVSAPAFATGIFFIYLFAVVLGWFPAFGQGEGFIDRLWHLTLPALALALTVMALILKLTRTAMISALEQDYVTFARARGVGPLQVLFTYAFRNALMPIVTAAGLILSHMLTGAVLIEVTFALPGLGLLLVNSVEVKDVPMVQGVTMVAASTIILVNLLTDVLYLFIDPRIRLGVGTVGT
jgi:peptide/nickel transport system permease protein